MQFLHQDFEIKHKNTFYSPLVEPNVLYVEIYPLYICNYKCFFCYIKNHYKNKKHPIMTRKNINDVLDSIEKSRYKVNLIVLGGEPLLYPYLNDILIRDFYRITLISNGSKKICGLNHKNNFEVTLSYYPNYCKDDNTFIQNMQYLHKNNINCTINVMKLTDDLRSERIVKIANAYNFPVEITPIIFKNKVVNKNVDFSKNDDDIFYYNSRAMSNFDVEREHLSFKDWSCLQSFFMIMADGCINQGCEISVDNIFTNRDFFKNYKIIDKKCQKEFCRYDSYLAQYKYNDEI